MSLISISERLRKQDAPARGVLTIILLAASIIVGLLAMHSLNIHADAAERHDTVAGTSDTVAVSVPLGAHSAAAATTPECADCGNDGSMAWMACVLALIAAVILLIGPLTRWWTAATRPRDSGGRGGWPAQAQALPPPPSLTVLCISRT